MVEFGDEFIIQSFKVPWLIWIQLLVMILLVILLFFGFAVFSLDASSSSAVASPSTAASPVHLNSPTSSDAITKVEDQRVGRDKVEESGEESTRIFRFQEHPCNYLGLAKQALFRCFGIDFNSDNRHEKQE